MKYKIALFLAWGATMAAVFLSTTPRAHADDASYLQAVAGVYHSIYGDQTMLHWGHGACDDMKSRTVDQEIAMAPPQFNMAMDVPAVIHAAQRELCPSLGH